MKQHLLALCTMALLYGCARGALLDFSSAVIPPKNVRASDGTYMDKIRITWDKSDGAASYQVWRSSAASGGFSAIATTTANEYDDATAFADVTYYYGVRSLSASGASTLSTIDSGSGAVDTRPFTPAGYYGNPGVTGTNNGEFNTPTGIVTDGTYLYIREASNHRIQRLTMAGASGGVLTGGISVWHNNDFGGCSTTATFCFSFIQSGGLAYSNGYLYASDTGNKRIQRIQPTTPAFAGRLGGGVDAWFMTSDIPVQDTTNEYLPRYYATNGTLYLAIHPEGYLIVADAHKQRVSIIDTSGALIRTFGATGTDDYAFSSGNGGGSLSGPRSVAVDASGNIYFADPLNFRISKYSVTGELIGHLYSGHSGWNKGLTAITDNPYVNIPGRFPNPNLSQGGIGVIAVDSKGYLYIDIFDGSANSIRTIQQFSPSGRYLQSFGYASGAQDGQLGNQYGSGGMIFGANDNILYVTNNHKVQKFSR